MIIRPQGVQKHDEITKTRPSKVTNNAIQSAKYSTHNTWSESTGRDEQDEMTKTRPPKLKSNTVQQAKHSTNNV